MRVAVVAGPDPGHAFPAAALAARLLAAGHEPIVYTGRWVDRLRAAGLAAAELPGARSAPDDPDLDFGYRLHGRAARAAPILADRLRADRPDLVVADTLTASGGFAAELVGVPWVELLPHPLMLPSVALPPPGSGLAPGRGPIGRGRDAVLRRLSARSVELGRRQRAAARAGIGLPAHDPGPAHRLVATLPALEPPRPDWPAATDVVGPLHWDPADRELPPPAGAGPLVFVSPPTAASGRPGLLAATLAAVELLRAEPLGWPQAAGPARRGEGRGSAGPRGGCAGSVAGSVAGLWSGLRSRSGAAAGVGDRGVRLAATVLQPYPVPAPQWAAIGPGRQEPLLAAASVVIAGGGHGVLSKALAIGVPLVLVPGGGDQRDLARRVARLGAGVVVEQAASPGRLAAALARVLADPRFRAAARAAAGTAAGVTDPVRLCAQVVANRVERPW